MLYVNTDHLYAVLTFFLHSATGGGGEGKVK